MGHYSDKISTYFKLFLEAVKGEERDYTQGNVRKAIILLAIPMILELSLESIFALVDMFFVGKLGQNAIAVVGYTESMITIVYSLSIGLSTAASSIIARRVGEKEFKSASLTAVNALMVSGVISLLVGVSSLFLSENMLRFMGASETVVAEGHLFTEIMFGCNAVIVFLFLINGIFRGAGNAALAMKSLWIASIINIVLDPIFIYGIGSWNGWGLEGAAIATCIGRGCGVLFQLFHLFSGSGLIKIKWSDFKPDLNIITSMLKIAWPATLQFIIASGSWIVLTKLVADTGGTAASAGYQIAIRNVVFFILPAWGLSNAAATLVGQNLGAGQIERAEKSVMLATKYNAFFMSLVMLLFICLSGEIIGFFSNDATVLEFGKEALEIIGSGFVFYGIGMVMIQSINGAGDTRTPTWIYFFGFWLFQIPLAYYLKLYTNLKITGAFLAIPVAEAVIAIVAYIIFRRGKWKLVKV